MDAERLARAFTSSEQEDIAHHLTNEALAVEVFRRGWLTQLTNQSSIYLADVENSGQPLQSQESAHRVRRAATALLGQLSVNSTDTGAWSSTYESLQGDPAVLALPIERLGINVGGYNALCRAGIRTIGEVIRRDKESLMALTGFGDASMQRLREALDDRRLHIAPSRPSRD